MAKNKRSNLAENKNNNLPKGLATTHEHVCDTFTEGKQWKRKLIM